MVSSSFTSPFSTQGRKVVSRASNWRTSVASTLFTLPPQSTSPGGVVGAVESDANRWVVGVQWHAEGPEPEHPDFAKLSRPLFQAFVDAVTRQLEEVH